MTTVICGCCANTSKLDGEVKGEIYFPNRMVYQNGGLVRCGNCYSFRNLVIFGEQYISGISLIISTKYYLDENVIQNNILWYEKQINDPYNEKRKLSDKYRKELLSYKNNCEYLKTKQNDTN